MSLSDRKKSKESTKYLSPTTDEAEFKKIADRHRIHNRKNSLLIENEGESEVIYQREDKELGKGAIGVTYKFTALQQGRKNRAVKTDNIAYKWVKIRAGLKEELNKANDSKDCAFGFLIQAMILDKKNASQNQQRINQLNAKSVSYTSIIHWLHYYISFASQNIRDRANIKKKDWEHETNFMQIIYGDTEILSGNYRLSMPLLPEKTVYNELNKNPHKTPLELLDLFINILHNYDALHLLFLIAHIDVKPDNMLIDDDGCIWPCDFGQSLKFAKDNYSIPGLNPSVYNHYAPELATGAHVDAKLDIYGLGLTGNKYISYFLKASNHHAQITDEKNFHVEFKKICDAMHQQKPDLRITLSDAQKRLIELRTKHFPKASPFEEKLNPIFRQKKILPLVTLKKWDTVAEIIQKEFNTQNTVHPLLLDIVLQSLEEKPIPETFVISMLNILLQSKKWDDIRDIATKLHSRGDLGRTFSSAILAIARDGQWDLVEYVAVRKATLRRAYADTGYSSLHFAVLHQQHNVVNILLRGGADTNFQITDKPAPIHLAIDNNDDETVKILFNHGLNVKLTYQGKDVIHYMLDHAHKKNTWKCINALLIRNNLPEKIFDQEIVYKIFASNSFETRNLLINHPAVNIQYLKTLALDAARNGHWYIVWLLAEKTARFNLHDTNGMTLLHFAVTAKQYDLLRKLLTYPLKPNFQLDEKPAPIHLAVETQDYTAIKILFDCVDFGITYQGKKIIEYAIDHAIKNNTCKDIIPIIFKEKFSHVFQEALDCLIKNNQWSIINCLDKFPPKDIPHFFDPVVLKAASAGEWRTVLHFTECHLTPVTPKILHLAIDANNLDAMKNLLSLTNSQMLQEEKILHYAIHKENWDAVNILLSKILSEYPPVDVLDHVIQAENWNAARIILSKILSEFPPVNAIAPILKMLSKKQPSVLKNLENEINNLIIHYLNRDDLNSISSLQKQLSNQFILSKNTTDALTQWKRSNLLKGLPGCTIGGIIGAIIGLLTPLPGAFWFGMAIGFAMGGYTEKFIRDRFINKSEFPMSMPQTSTENNPPSPKIQHLSLPNSSHQLKRKDDFTMGKTQYKIFLDSKHTPRDTSKNKLSRVTLG